METAYVMRVLEKLIRISFRLPAISHQGRYRCDWFCERPGAGECGFSHAPITCARTGHLEVVPHEERIEMTSDMRGRSMILPHKLTS